MPSNNRKFRIDFDFKMRLPSVLFIFCWASAIIASPQRPNSGAKLPGQETRSGEPALFNFSYEGITPQNILTGCQGSTYSDGRTMVEFYVVDGTGNKKFVRPDGGGITVVFPGLSMFAPAIAAPVVHHKDICFPPQCGSSTCGFIIGPVNGFGATQTMQTSSFSSTPNINFSQFFGFPKNNGSSAGSRRDAASAESAHIEPHSGGSVSAEPPRTEQSWSKNHESVFSGSFEPHLQRVQENFHSNGISSADGGSAHLEKTKQVSMKFATACAPTFDHQPQKTLPPCQSGNSAEISPPPTANRTCTPLVPPYSPPSCAPPTPPPQCNCVCNCAGERSGLRGDGGLMEPLIHPSAFVSRGGGGGRQGGSGPSPKPQQRNEAAYYASLPGAIRGHTGVIYYPSCEPNAYHQAAIIPFCDSARGGRALDLGKFAGGDNDELIKDSNDIAAKKPSVKSDSS